MSDKKAKKGKGKGKKKGKKDKKDGLSNLERERYLQTISDLEHKILWRNYMRDIIREDLYMYEELLDLEKSDKTEAVYLLEHAIKEEKKLYEKIINAIPEAEEAKAEGEERRSSELAAKLLQMNNEKHSYDEQIESLKRKLKVLDSYSPEAMKEKIEMLEKQQQEQKDAEDALLKQQSELDKQREEVFRKDMEDIMAMEVDSFQAEIAGKSDKSFQRITEETRWWADEVSRLQVAKNRLKLKNHDILSNLQESQRKLLQRRDTSLRVRQELRETEAVLKDLAHRNKELQREYERNAEFQNRIATLDGLSDNLRTELDAQDEILVASINQVEENEKEIKMLEDKLLNEETFNSQLTKYFDEVENLIREEVMLSLVITYGGEQRGKNTFEELRRLFEEATEVIYNREHQTMMQEFANMHL